MSYKEWKGYKKNMTGICKHCANRNLQVKCYVCGAPPRRKAITVGNKDIQFSLRHQEKDQW